MNELLMGALSGCRRLGSRPDLYIMLEPRCPAPWPLHSTIYNLKCHSDNLVELQLHAADVAAVLGHRNLGDLVNIVVLTQ